jgi:hypothetical protein
VTDPRRDASYAPLMQHPCTDVFLVAQLCPLASRHLTLALIFHDLLSDACNWADSGRSGDLE